MPRGMPLFAEILDDKRRKRKLKAKLPKTKSKKKIPNLVAPMLRDSCWTKRQWKSLAKRLALAEAVTYCHCGDNSEHDPAAMCLQCRLQSARFAIEERMTDNK